MNGLDIFFLLILTLGVIRGLFQGLIREVSSILSLVAGFFAANKFYPLLTPYLKVVVSPGMAQIASYGLILLLVIAIVFLLGTGVQRLLHVSLLGGFDRILGSIAGLLKAGLFCSLALFLLTVLLPQDNTILRDSQTAPYVHRFTRTFCALIPEDLRSSFQEKSLALHRSWQKKDLNDLSKE